MAADTNGALLVVEHLEAGQFGARQACLAFEPLVVLAIKCMERHVSDLELEKRQHGLIHQALGAAAAVHRQTGR